MTEYLIIVALIAVAAIGVYSSLGNVIRAKTGVLAQEIAGQNGQAGNTAAAQAGNQAQTRGTAQRSLADFNAGNR